MPTTITFESELLADGHLAVPDSVRPVVEGLNGKKLKVVVGPVEDSECDPNAWFRAAYELFAPVREEASRRYPPEQIDQFIDEAVDDVRKRNRS